MRTMEIANGMLGRLKKFDSNLVKLEKMKLHPEKVSLSLNGTGGIDLTRDIKENIIADTFKKVTAQRANLQAEFDELEIANET